MKNQIMKPITVARAEFIECLKNVINDSMLPAFIIEPILKDMYLETKAVAQRQYELDKQKYEKALFDSENNCDDISEDENEEENDNYEE